MEKEHKKKINEALKLCETSMQYVFEVVDKNVEDKKRAKDIQQFLMLNTFFAGGLFRSVLTDAPVNDIDIFFNNEDAVFEFRHICATDLKEVFKKEHSLSSQFTYYLKRTKNPDISFITAYAGLPAMVCNRFDYTFNQHFFSMKDYEMMIDIDTFKKIGQVIHLEGDPILNMKRTLRFASEGFKLTNYGTARLIYDLMSLDKPIPDGWSIDRINQQLSGTNSSGEVAIEKTGFTNHKYYTHDYFESDTKPKAKKAKRMYSIDPASLGTWGGGGGATLAGTVTTGTGGTITQATQPTTPAGMVGRMVTPDEQAVLDQLEGMLNEPLT